MQFCRLCESSVGLSSLDSVNLVDSVIGDFMDIAQYNGDNTNYANITVPIACEVMKDSSTGAPIKRLAKLNSMYMAGYGETCIDFKYKKMIRELRQTELTSSVADGGNLHNFDFSMRCRIQYSIKKKITIDRQWFYQDCNEFGYFQSTDGKHQVFGNMVNVDFLIRQCTDVFGKG